MSSVVELAPLVPYFFGPKYSSSNVLPAPEIFSDISERKTTILTPSTSEGGDICIRSYDTGRSFDPIFMKFTWLVRVHSW